MSKTSTWMPLYIGDYLADTMQLEAREHGAYLLLLMHYWRNGPLPDDDRALAGIARVDRKTWLSDTGPIVRAFFTVENGRLHQKRIDRERLDADENSAKKRRAAQQRWDAKRQAEQCADDAHASPHAYAEQPNSDVQTACPYAGVPPSPSPVTNVTTIPSGIDAEASESRRSDRDILWQDGLPLLKRLVGKGVDATRSLLGRMAKDVDDDARLMALLRQCDEEKIIDPAAWLTRATQKKPKFSNGFFAMDLDPEFDDARTD